jgi:hypothetical protein
VSDIDRQKTLRSPITDRTRLRILLEDLDYALEGAEFASTAADVFGRLRNVCTAHYRAILDVEKIEEREIEEYNERREGRG